MSEQQLREFGERAVELVALPDLEELEQRGTRLRRRRQAVAAGLTAAVVAAVGWASVNVSQPKADQSPAGQDDRASSATRLYGFGTRPEVDPGTYTWPVSHEPGRPDVVVDLPARWHAWDVGPNRWLEEDRPAGGTGYVGLIVTDVYDVVDEPCRAGSGMKEVGDSPQELVDALASMPRHEVVAGPRSVARFGSQATYLRLRALHVECANGEDFLLTSHNGTDMTIPTAGQGALMDAWVVDAGTRPVLVLATWEPGSPGWLVAQLHDVVDTVRIVEP